MDKQFEIWFWSPACHHLSKWYVISFQLWCIHNNIFHFLMRSSNWQEMRDEYHELNENLWIYKSKIDKHISLVSLISPQFWEILTITHLQEKHLHPAPLKVFSWWIYKFKKKENTKYSMTGIKGMTLFLSSLSDCIMFKVGIHKENCLN